ncbi:hypothetical protein [Tepidibacter hydrothermalis]|uniref:Uncharacterized protein n=1 Tax=Tepidibacter hydrothermalis TaxID=3036126 RepID=A0ABY8E850_9FIRM|nr:hypothetical protein [Tepidibacter hydrothermalis]WFD09024.1 hypothetical protein P4S50_11570 [Tepidibacter hydrothermalis]
MNNITSGKDICNIITLVCIVGIGYIVFLFCKKEINKMESSLPNLVSTIGVLGTFGGICVSLYFFNPNSIDSSVPNLLDGMKTAFVTSVVGMFASIIMKGNQWKKINQHKGEEYFEDAEQLFNCMLSESRNLNSTLINNQNQMLNRFADMDNNWNEKQIELIDEIKNLGNSLNKKQDDLIGEFRIFAETMAEQNSKSLIEALKEVIKDFNTKMTEQFGENFKELNKAVGALLEWQGNYKEHVELTITQLETTIKSITQIEKSMENISEKSYGLIETSEALDVALTCIDENQKQIYDNIKILSEVSQNAKELLPNINTYFEESNKSINGLLVNVDGAMKENIDKLDVHVKELTVDVAQAAGQIFEEVKNNCEESNKSINGLLVNVDGAMKENIDKLDVHVKELTVDVAQAAGQIFEEVKNNCEESNKSINGLLVNVDGAMKENIDKLDVHVKELTVDVAQAAGQIFEEVKNNCEESNKSINGLLVNVDGAMKENIDKLDVHVKELTVDAAQAAGQIFEEVKKNFEESNTMLQRQVDEYLQDFNIVVKELNNCIPEINEHIEASTERFNSALITFSNEIGSSLETNLHIMQSQVKTTEDTTNKIGQRLEITVNDLNSRIEDITINTSEQIKKLVEEVEKVFEQKVDQLDKLLEQELSNSLNSLGTQLATVSEKFVDDYTPLTEKLREVVSIAKGVSA